jgi:CRISPR type I-E-associated protein CasB/Cse2
MSQTQPLPRSFPARATMAREWWAQLTDPKRGDRGVLARLRRAQNPLDAAVTPAAMALYRRLGFGEKQLTYRLTRVGALAHALAFARTDRPNTGFSRALGARREGTSNAADRIYSELRFQRLMRAADDGELMIQLRRAVAILRDTVDIESFSDFVLNFDHDRARARFIFDYYGAGFAAPRSPSSQDDE